MRKPTVGGQHHAGRGEVSGVTQSLAGVGVLDAGSHLGSSGHRGQLLDQSSVVVRFEGMLDHRVGAGSHDGGGAPRFGGFCDQQNRDMSELRIGAHTAAELNHREVRQIWPDDEQIQVHCRQLRRRFCGGTGDRDHSPGVIENRVQPWHQPLGRSNQQHAAGASGFHRCESERHHLLNVRSGARLDCRKTRTESVEII